MGFLTFEDGKYREMIVEYDYTRGYRGSHLQPADAPDIEITAVYPSGWGDENRNIKKYTNKLTSEMEEKIYEEEN